MIYRSSLFSCLIFLLFSCQEKVQNSTIKPEVLDIEKVNEHLIEAEELLVLLNHENIKIVDFRKKEEYLKGHVPNALNVNRSHIENADYAYKGMMADKKNLQILLRNLGIENDDIVVVYDDKGSSDAARFWWVMKTNNFDRVKLLNGGWSAWKAIDGTISKNNAVMKPSSFSFEESDHQNLFIDKEGVFEVVLGQKEAVLIDTRTTEEYEGIKIKKGAMKAGHIPKSINVDWANSMDDNQKFKSKDELKAIYAPLIITKENAVVTYCHSGVRSAHTMFVLTELLGYENVKNYDGSWTEWSYFDELPLEVGPGVDINLK